MSQNTSLTFTFADESSAAAFNAWFAQFLGRLNAAGAPLDAAFIQTRVEREGVTKRVEFDSPHDLLRAVNADIAGQVAALKRSALQCASC